MSEKMVDETADVYIQKSYLYSIMLDLKLIQRPWIIFVAYKKHSIDTDDILYLATPFHLPLSRSALAEQ